jgi:hypothetical protein
MPNLVLLGQRSMCNPSREIGSFGSFENGGLEGATSKSESKKVGNEVRIDGTWHEQHHPTL